MVGDITVELPAVDAAQPRLTSLTLEQFLAGRSAGMDLVRLILAFLVLVSHTWALGGFGDEPPSPLTPRFLTLGGFAVGGFFALSGLLVGRSALNRAPRAFARSRAVRILPAYFVTLIISAFGAGLIGWIHDRGTLRGFFSFAADGPFTYVGRAALMPIEFSHGIGDVFARSTPYGRATGNSWINGSLWTLPYEMRCYLVVGLLAVLAPRFGGRRVIATGLLITAVLAAGFHWGPAGTTFVVGPYLDAQLVALVFVFLAGALAAAYADRIRLFGPLTVLALIVAVAAGLRSLFFAEHVANAMLVLLLPPIAALLGHAAGVLQGADLSYGLYLYAWPVQQVIALHDWATSPVSFIIISTVFASMLAAASWYGIERPLLRRWKPR